MIMTCNVVINYLFKLPDNIRNIFCCSTIMKMLTFTCLNICILNYQATHLHNYSLINSLISKRYPLLKFIRTVPLRGPLSFKWRIEYPFRGRKHKLLPNIIEQKPILLTQQHPPTSTNHKYRRFKKKTTFLTKIV